MNREQIQNEVVMAISTLFEIPITEITLNAKLYEDLDLDSIDAVDLVVHLQNVMKKKVDPETFKQVRTVNDVVNAVDELLKA